MILFLVILVLISCYGMKFSSFHRDYMSIPSTTAIKGVFAIIILLSHASSYLNLGLGFPDRAFGFTMRYLGQLMVAVYFFYSGYGILESAKKKKGYADRFFKNRFLKTWLHFALAVLLFLILQCILGNRFETLDYVLCWTGWRSIGNSNWFMFVILALYMASYIILLLQKRVVLPEWIFALLASMLAAGLWAILFHFKPSEHWWYDTIAAFPAGMWFSLLKEEAKTPTLVPHILITLAVLAGFALWRHFIGIDILGACTVLFSLAITAFSTWVKLDNPLLQWLGKHCFSLYILQRIPMILLSHFGWQDHKFLFTSAVIFLALLLAWGFTAMTDFIDKKLFA